jgi:hypothetical protein
MQPSPLDTNISDKLLILSHHVRITLYRRAKHFAETALEKRTTEKKKGICLIVDERSRKCPYSLKKKWVFE